MTNARHAIFKHSSWGYKKSGRERVAARNAPTRSISGQFYSDMLAKAAFTPDERHNFPIQHVQLLKTY